MPQRSPQYDRFKAAGKSALFPIRSKLLKWWEHCETYHDATPEDFGSNVVKWHKEKHPQCEFPEARKAQYALQNMMFGFICGEIKAERTSLGPVLGKESKFYDTEDAVLEAYTQLSVAQRMVISPVQVLDPIEILAEDETADH